MHLTFRLVKIDETQRGDHSYLTAADECYFLGEYQPRAGFQSGDVNNLISNFKKPVDRRGRAEWHWKEQAILRVGRLVASAFKADRLGDITFVPMPPSRVATDPMYDDRMARALLSVPQLEVRQALVMRESARAHHEYAPGEARPTPDVLYPLMSFDTDMLPLRQVVVLVDDVLTNGTHFVAAKRHVLEHCPDARVLGMFIGRRKVRDPLEDFEAL